MNELLERLAPSPLIVILRAANADTFVAVTDVLYQAGIRCVEFTLTTAGVLGALQQARAALPDDLVLGVGTVRTEQHVADAVEAGAHFLVSQVFQLPLVRAATDAGIPYFPGALTPTEIVNAWDSGVSGVKVSPIGPLGGLEYFDQLRGPLPDIPLMPTGGILPQDVTAYLDRGAVAVGLSGPLLGDALLPGGDLVGLADRVGDLVRTVGVRQRPESTV